MKRLAIGALAALLSFASIASAQVGGSSNPGVVTQGAVTPGNIAKFVNRFRIQDGGTLPATFVSSWNGRTGVVIPAGGDYTIGQITNGLSNALIQNHIFVGSAGGLAVDVAMTGDCNIVSAGTINCFNSVAADNLLGNASAAPAHAANVPLLSCSATASALIYNTTTHAFGCNAHSVSNADGTLTISPTSGAVVASLNLAHANSWTGDQFFGSGKPWADVRAFGAVCDNSTDDTTAIRNAIAAVNTTGGTVYFPPGSCKITGILTITGAVCLVGTNATASAISGTTSDFTAVSFAASIAHACIEKLSIYGFQNVAAAQPTVLVGANAAVHMRDCRVWGGVFALRTAGVDGRITNCYFSGWNPNGGGVDSTGANFWTANKIDQGTVPTSFGFHQGTPPALAENHFDQTDFSGNYTVASFNSDDAGTARNINIVIGGIMSSPVIINSAKYTSFVGTEFGHTTLTNTVGPMSVVGSFGFAAMTATGAGTRSCAGNIQITC